MSATPGAAQADGAIGSGVTRRWSAGWSTGRRAAPPVTGQAGVATSGPGASTACVVTAVSPSPRKAPRATSSAGVRGAKSVRTREWTTKAACLPAGDRDVEPVPVEQEPQPAGASAARGRRQRDDRDGRLLPLELVDRADGDLGEPGVVERAAGSGRPGRCTGATTMTSAARAGGPISARPRLGRVVQVRPTRSWTRSTHRVGLLGRRRWVAVVVDGHDVQAGLDALERAVGGHRLVRAEPARRRTAATPAR